MGNDGWISVTDRLPDIDGDYVVWVEEQNGTPHYYRALEVRPFTTEMNCFFTLYEDEFERKGVKYWKHQLPPNQ